jgi:hypothetical protein
MSGADKAQRAVMLELVFGPKPEEAPADPVDAKMESLIRESLHKAVAGEPITQDDMTIDAAYSRASSTSEFDFIPRRPRSNSTTGIWRKKPMPNWPPVPQWTLLRKDRLLWIFAPKM